MPRLNLKDEGLGAEGAPESGKSPTPTPVLREVGGGGGRVSPIILIILIVVVLAGGVYALNHFKVIRLWGKKAPVVTETLPEPDAPLTAQTPSTTDQGAQPAATTGKEGVAMPGEGSAAKSSTAKKGSASMKAAAASAPSGSGRYTVQFAAWMSKSKADQQASLLAAAGYEAFVDESHAGGDRLTHQDHGEAQHR